MLKDNLSRMAGAVAVFSLAMAGSGATGAMAQSHDSHDQVTAAAEPAGHAGQGHGNETSASESDWLKMTVDSPGAHAGHDEQANAGHGEHGPVAETPTGAAASANDAGHGNQPVLSESDWMKTPVVDRSERSPTEHTAHAQN